MSTSIYTTTNKNIFYVYAYRYPLKITDTNDDGIRYIGKGSNGRANAKHRNGIPVPENKNNIIFLSISLSENTAFYIERFFIKCYGRKDNGTGILLNRTDGGDNPPNHTGRKHSQSTKDLLSEKLTGRILSQSTKDLISKKRTGIKLSQKTKDKIRESHIGEKNQWFIGYYHVPFFEKFTSSTALKDKGIDSKSMIKYCKTKNTKIILKLSYSKSKFLQYHFGPEIIGQTFKDIGFWFESV